MKHRTYGDTLKLGYRVKVFFLRLWWKFSKRGQPIVLDIDERQREMVFRRIDWKMREVGLQGIVDNFFQETPLFKHLRETQ